MKKIGKLLGVLAALALCLMGSAALAEEHSHTNWTGINTLPTEAGNYYLTGNVLISEKWIVPDGTVILCLNGHTIRASGSFDSIQINNGATLNVYDENDSGKIYRSGSYSYNIVNIRGGTFNLHGGCISESRKKGVYMTSGSITMSGGKITGNSGRGIHMVDGSFIMSGGEISSNNDGGVFQEGGSFTMSGGLITGNSTDNNGGGVFIKVGSFTMSGGTISDNQAKGRYVRGAECILAAVPLL